MSGSEVVTVLFTDLVDSTALEQRVGSDRWDDVRSRHFAALREALQSHHGREVKTAGDGVMAVFDSVLDALDCAVTMQQAVDRDNGQPGDVPLALRVGLSAGEVTGEASDWFGMPVTEASRLCAAARGGQILAADLVRQLCRGRGTHVFGPSFSLTLKGLSDSVAACEVSWGEPGEHAPPTTIRVVLAEDNDLLREGLSRLIGSADGVTLAGVAADLPSLLELIEREKPDVVVTDIRMPPTATDEGIQAASYVRETHPATGVVVLSQFAEPAYAMALLADGSGGRAYLLKERVAGAGELARAIREVAAGGSVIDPGVVEILVAANSKRRSSELEHLTPRETEVLGEMAQGKSNAAIARDLTLSERAVEKHTNSIFSKLGLSEEKDLNRRVKAVLLYLNERAAL